MSPKRYADHSQMEQQIVLRTVPNHKPHKSEYDRFWGNVNKTDGCWEWMAHSHCPYGYGGIYLRGRTLLTHRASYLINVGPIPDGLFVLHKCDNPKCVRPDHLFLGTQADNVADMARKGRKRTWLVRGILDPRSGGYRQKQKTHCKYGHEFAVTARILANGRRECRLCRRRVSKEAGRRMRERRRVLSEVA